MFRRRIESRDLITAPGVYDALLGKLVEKAGFEALYLSGAGVSYSTLGQPDVGLVTFHEMVQALEKISQSVEIPIIADADNGYGNPLNVRRTVQTYERVGAYAIQLEDQALPKKCGHMAGKTVLPAAEATQKVRAAVDAKQDADTLIIARTDALAVNGFADAMDRVKRYEDAGADVIFVEAPADEEQMQRVCEVVSVPCMANMVEGGRTPLIPNERLQEIGYRLVIYPNMLTRVVARQVQQALEMLKSQGTSAELIPNMMLFKELNQLLDIDAIHRLEQNYAID